MRGLRLPLALSLAGHAIFLSLLVWLSARLPPLMLYPPTPPQPVTVIFAAPPALNPPPPKPRPVVVKPPPPPPPPPKVVAVPKPPPVVRHVEAKPRPRPARRREVRRRIEQRVRREVDRRPPPRVMPPQTAALPPPAPVHLPPPAPIVSPAYSRALAEWFAAHRRYPESARQRGEEGTGVLRLEIDRSGRVLSQTLVRSTGYADLDRAIGATMRGAVLPAFPAVMAESEREISVTIPFQFRLEQ